MLQKKVNADFLQNTRDYINGEMNKTPMTYTYGEALASYRSKVNQKFPPQLNPSNRNRGINQANIRYRHVQQGRGNRGGGRNHQRHGGRGRHQNNTRSKRGHPDAKWIRGRDGKQIEVHPSYDFPSHIWNNLPKGEQDKIRQERLKHKTSKCVASTVEAIMNESNLDARSIISAMTDATRARNVSQTKSGTGSGDGNGSPSANSNRSTMMGGRNEQTDL